MNASRSATVTLDSKAVDAALGLLVEAARELPPSPREQKRYRVFEVSVDIAVFSVSLGYAIVMFILPFAGKSRFEVPTLVVASLFFLAFFVGSFTAMAAALMNHRFLRRVIAQRRQMRRLGLHALSRRLRRAYARTRWLSRMRDSLLGLFGIAFVATGVLSVAFVAVVLLLYGDRSPWAHKLFPDSPIGAVGLAVYLGVIVVVGLFLLLSRVLRNTREEIELAGNADDLRKALAELRASAGAANAVEVPAALIERAAQIESVLIEKERSRAIVENARSGRAGLAISFDAEAAAQRAQLPAEARLELEDLLAQVSSDGLAGLPSTGAQAEPQERRIAQNSPTGRVQAIFTAGHAPGAARVVAVHVLQPAPAAGSPEQERHG